MMKKWTIGCLLFLAMACGEKAAAPDNKPAAASSIPDKAGMTVKGKIIDKATRKPLEGVVVSDGRNCTATDADGLYWLPTNLSEQRVVTVCTPSGYQPGFNESGGFADYRLLTSGKKAYECNFSLSPIDGDPDRYTVVFAGDPQIASTGNYIEVWNTVAEKMGRWSETKTGRVYAVQLGDLVYNEMNLFDTYKIAQRSCKVPTFPVIGNHDHEPSTYGEWNSTAAWTSSIGPRNYSVNLGKFHFIFLDSIIWSDDGSRYKEGFDDEALTFLENDLFHVPAGVPLQICTHACLTREPNNAHRSWTGSERFHKAIAGRNVDCWYGHYHISRFYAYTEAECKAETKAASLETHIVGRCTGQLGSNMEICGDGVPRGWVVAEVDGTQMQWRYHSTEDEDEPQLYVYVPGEIGGEYVWANVFLKDNLWGDVEWWEGSAKADIMELDEEGMDPLFNYRYRQVNTGTGPEKKSSTHLYKIRPSGNSGEVRVKDRFGNTWTKAVSW